MKKQLLFTLMAIMMSFMSFALTPITGDTVTCVGSSSLLADSLSPGGIWTSSNTSIATVSSTSIYNVMVTGVSAGTATITYTLGASYVTQTFLVSPLPAPITGATAFCTYASITLANSVPGGEWYSGNPSVATVGSTSGVVTGGVYGGTASITYTMPGWCSTAATVTVTASYVDSTRGPRSIILCPGATTTLTNPTPGGTWSSSDITRATVSSSGVVTAIATGYSTISYTVTGTCGPAAAIKWLFVSPSSASPSPVSGPSSLHVGATATYTASYRGTWISSNPGVGSIDATTGVLTALSAGTATISYGESGCSGMVYTTKVVSISTLNGISGHVRFPGISYFRDTVKVYLIKYNPSTLDLQAVDSTSGYLYDTTFYYEFSGVSTDSFRVKACGRDSTGPYTGFMPTYHTSHFYWYSSNVIYHTAGTADINKDIVMVYGTVAAGPGFIGGNVTTGANKGTDAATPAVGLRMYLVNSATGKMTQQTKTDASGNYTFTKLPIGATYYVHPEAEGYLTTIYPGITITSGAPSMTGASFVQHTVSHTITPILVENGTNNLSNNNSSVLIFPNPTNGKTTIQWNVASSETGNISVTDVTGRQVYSSVIDMTKGTGVKQIDLSGLADGLYIINVKSATLNYNSKIEVVK